MFLAAKAMAYCMLMFMTHVLLRDVVKHYCVVCDESEFTKEKCSTARVYE